MKNLVFLVLVCISNMLPAQTWQLLPASPQAGFRHDDIFFINADTGWVVNVDGYIFRTLDGGISFDTLLYQPATSFRSVGFADANNGWVGNLGTGAWNPTTDTMPMYETHDGGINWQPVSNITGSIPKGICGISVVNDQVVYAVGRVGGPSTLLKTIDGGNTWVSLPVTPSPFYLIDCKFFSADTGIVAGCTGTNWNNEKTGIWYTSDGAQTWQLVYNDSSSFLGHCWKLDFVTRTTGYASVESSCGNCDTIPVMKTTDGGLTWQKKIWETNFTNGFPFEQGIGFIDEQTGWCGHAVSKVKQTTDGGNTWSTFPFVGNFNRFRKVNDSTAYASGNRIWKYTKQSVGINSIDAPEGLKLEQNFPNPFTTETKIRYTIPSDGYVLLSVYDFAGRPVSKPVNQKQVKGTYEFILKLPYYHDSHFYYTLSFNNYLLTRKAIMIDSVK